MHYEERKKSSLLHDEGEVGFVNLVYSWRYELLITVWMCVS